MRCSAMLVFMVAMLLPCWTSAAIVRTLPEVLYAPVTPTGSITIAIGFEPLQVVEVPTNLNFRFGGISPFVNHRIEILNAGSSELDFADFYHLSDPGVVFPQLLTSSYSTLGGGNVVQASEWQMSLSWHSGLTAQQINEEGGALIRYVFVDGDTDISGEIHSVQFWATDASSPPPGQVPLPPGIVLLGFGLASLLTVRRRYFRTR